MARLREPDWHTATNPDVLLAIVRPHTPYIAGSAASTLTPAAQRRLRLFCCACARMVWEFLPTDARSAIQIRERFLDGRASRTDLQATEIRVPSPAVGYREYALRAAGWEFPESTAREAAKARATRAAGPAPAEHRAREKWHSIWNDAFAEARAHQAELVRDIFPPPGYTPVLRPDWRTSTVVALARQMDETGDFSAVPILADALQDAGCDDETILDRCRALSGIHCRGNWVVDLVLDRV